MGRIPSLLAELQLQILPHGFRHAHQQGLEPLHCGIGFDESSPKIAEPLSGQIRLFGPQHERVLKPKIERQTVDDLVVGQIELFLEDTHPKLAGARPTAPTRLGIV